MAMPVTLAAQKTEIRMSALSLSWPGEFMKPCLEKYPTQKTDWWSGSSGRAAA
jgi:hypothetical protein